MAGAQTLAGVAMEIFVEQNVVAPMRVLCEARVAAIAGAVARCVREEERGQTSFDFAGGFLQGHHIAGAGGTLDLEVVAIKMVVTFQRLNDEEVDWKPD